MNALLELALDPTVETPADEASERILDAALEIAAASGLRAVTMDAVPARAGVGRMTVYRRFGSRDELIQSLVVRESRRVLAGLAAGIDTSVPLAERVATGFVSALAVAAEHPLLERLARLEPETVIANLRADDGFVLGVLRNWLAVQIATAQAAREARPGDPVVIADVLVRVGLSYVLLPDEGVVGIADEKRARAFARDYLMPLLAP